MNRRDTNNGRSTPAAPGSQFKRQPRSRSDLNLHRPKRENPRYHNFRLPGHLQIPHDEDRQYSKGPIGQCCNSRCSVRRISNNLWVHTFRRTRGHRPELGDRITLEEHEEEISSSKDERCEHHHADDPNVGLLQSYAEKEDAKCDFQHTAAEDVKQLGEIPELRDSQYYGDACRGCGETNLKGFLDILGLDVPDVSTCTMQNSSNLTGQKGCEQKLFRQIVSGLS